MARGISGSRACAEHGQKTQRGLFMGKLRYPACCSFTSWYSANPCSFYNRRNQSEARTGFRAHDNGPAYAFAPACWPFLPRDSTINIFSLKGQSPWTGTTWPEKGRQLYDISKPWHCTTCLLSVLGVESWESAAGVRSSAVPEQCSRPCQQLARSVGLEGRTSMKRNGRIRTMECWQVIRYRRVYASVRLKS